AAWFPALYRLEKPEEEAAYAFADIHSNYDLHRTMSMLKFLNYPVAKVRIFNNPMFNLKYQLQRELKHKFRNARWAVIGLELFIEPLMEMFKKEGWVEQQDVSDICLGCRIFEKNNRRVAFVYLEAYAADSCTALINEIHEQGVRHFVFWGSCGGLNNGQQYLDPVIPTGIAHMDSPMPTILAKPSNLRFDPIESARKGLLFNTYTIFFPVAEYLQATHPQKVNDFVAVEMELFYLAKWCLSHLDTKFDAYLNITDHVRSKLISSPEALEKLMESRGRDIFKQVSLVTNLYAIDITGLVFVDPALTLAIGLGMAVNEALRQKIHNYIGKARTAGKFGVAVVAMEMPLEDLQGNRLKVVGGRAGGQAVYMKDVPANLYGKRGIGSVVMKPLFSADVNGAYSSISEFIKAYGGEVLMDIEVPVGFGTIPLKVIYVEQEGVPVLLIYDETGYFFVGLYNTPSPDSLGGYVEAILLPRAALEIAQKLGVEFDLLHFNDWQTALIPVYLKTIYKDDPFYKDIKTVFTIHNMAYQGTFSKDEYPKLGISWEYFNMEGLEFYEMINLMKVGLIFSDFITTVSPTYSKEIQTPEFGCKLEGVLTKRKNCLSGILNGIDYDEWNPKTDKELVRKYSSALAGDKVYNK
ncbi:MAG: glycogen/starch synthase, partial [Candidatus Omnitrophica bacterium]|nr:glycogen/starch synthase [Candidatus Omnitrophota bacterium]